VGKELSRTYLQLVSFLLFDNSSVILFGTCSCVNDLVGKELSRTYMQLISFLLFDN
jgi:hypothetical protein